jgi:triosephosphate isomerase
MKKTIPLIIGNWKLNPLTQSDAVALAHGVAKKHKNAAEPYVAIAPPYPFLTEVAKKIAKSSVALAAQDVSEMAVGAFTGEVSAAQLKNVGTEFCIIGHSERRAMGETDAQVLAKVQAVVKHKMVPVVCVGERTRDENGNFLGFVEAQLMSLASGLAAAQMRKVVIAYEPIWAIGTGDTATVGDVKEMQLFIESVLTKVYDRSTARAVRLLYGGSVKPHNAAELQEGGGMMGFLVGGASLKAEDFLAIIDKSLLQ